MELNDENKQKKQENEPGFFWLFFPLFVLCSTAFHSDVCFYGVGRDSV